MAKTKILIVRFSSIGDIVLTTPVVRCLAEQLDTEIHYLTKKQFEPILKANPYIHKIHTLDDNLNQVLSEIEKLHMHYVIDLHNNIRSFQVKTKLKAVSYTVNKINFKKWMMVQFKIDQLPEKHIVDRYLETCQGLEIENDHNGLDYFIPQNEEVDFSLIPSTHRENYIAFAIGGNHYTKKLPAEKLLDICQRIKKPVFLLGGPPERDMGEYLRQKIGENIYNGCGKFSLNESASIVQNAHLVVTHDTGMMHIASAFKKEVISIWGNTIPKFGMTPYMAGENSELFEVKGLSCRPCSKIGFDKCPKGHFKCMQDQDVFAIIDAINNN